MSRVGEVQERENGANDGATLGFRSAAFEGDGRFDGGTVPDQRPRVREVPYLCSPE